MGVIHPYLWSRPTWLAALIVIAVLALIAAAIALTIPGRVARGRLLLLAAPAYPGGAWAVGISGSYGSDTSGFPNLLFLPTALFTGLAVAALWQWRRRSAT